MARRLGVQVACRRAVVGHFLILFDSEVVSGRVTTEVRPVAGLELFELAVLTERHGWGGGLSPQANWSLSAMCHIPGPLLDSILMHVLGQINSS